MKKHTNLMSLAVGRRSLAKNYSGQQLTTNDQRPPQSGFSLLEMVIVCALLTVIMGAIFGQIRQGQLNSVAEQVKLDLFQESREFMDQLSRDLRASGYPNTRNYSADPYNPAQNSSQEALGLVKIDAGELWFESSTDGSGKVSVIVYQFVSTGTNCPCLVRSQVDKVQADPLNGQTNPTNQTEVQNVLNGTTNDPIFQAYYSDGTAVALPMDLTADCTGGQCLANVNTIAITLKVQSPYPDPTTGQKPTMTLLSTVRLNNCSVAYPNTSGTVMGCK